MSWIASSSMATRTPARGQPSPTTCSLRFSPVPTPRKNRPGHHRRARGRGLRHDRRVDPDRRTGDSRTEPQAFGRVRDPADHRPDEGALTLPVDPGMEMVRDQRELEPRLLGSPRARDEGVRRVLLARQRVPNPNHESPPRSARRFSTRVPVAGAAETRHVRPRFCRPRSSLVDCPGRLHRVGGQHAEAQSLRLV